MAGRVLLALAPILAPGCGPDPEIISKQGEQIRREYERQKYEPPGLTPQEKQVRRERIEQEYGGLVPD